uniref:RNA-directed DNA polymerase n=1 Tax=Lygus hesperus TaxID=30085 RepID=A0A146LGM0_LYGHE
MYDMVHVVTSTCMYNSPLKAKYQAETCTDPTLQSVRAYYVAGWPRTLPTGDSELSHYYSLRNEITLSENLLFYHDRILVPVSLRRFTIELLHETHLGLHKIQSQATSNFYWPGMLSDLRNFLQSCSLCNRLQRSKIKDPLQPHEIPNLPFAKIAADLADFGGKAYLVVVDFYSRWLEVIEIPNKSAHAVICSLKKVFCQFGVPQQFLSDNVPFNSMEFRQFALDWNFEAVTSSPHYPRSNGLAEKAVGIAKSLLQRAAHDRLGLELGLLNYRNSPVAGLPYSPAELLQSRLLRSKIMLNPSCLQPKVVADPIVSSKPGQTDYYDKSARSSSAVFRASQLVYVQDMNRIRGVGSQGLLLKSSPIGLFWLT